MSITARDVLDHFRKVGEWVDWSRTCDEILHGDPSTEVTGIATGWIPTNAAIEEAAGKGMNLFITHEPGFCDGFAQSGSGRTLIENKRSLLDRLGMVLLRCHDTWDRMPDVGIPDAWAEWLGFPTEPRPVHSFYRVCLAGGLTVRMLAERIRARVEPLGETCVRVLGEPDKRVHRFTVGTGAITHLPSMYELDADAILATDDGMDMWNGGLWALDLGVPILIVNHATAEKPGMMAMARYLRDTYPGVPAEYVDVVFPPRCWAS